VDADCNATKADPQLPPNVGGVSCGYSWSAYQPTLKDAPAGPGELQLHDALTNSVTLDPFSIGTLGAF
jgi:hypothetical protein